MGSPCPASQGNQEHSGVVGGKKDTAGEIHSMYFRIRVKFLHFLTEKRCWKTGGLPSGSAMSCGIMAGTGGVTNCTSPLAFTSYSLKTLTNEFQFLTPDLTLG